jgi:hypothetical protein
MKTKNVLLTDMEATFKKCLETAVKKNNDYAGEKTTDPYKNFRGSEFVGVSVEQGILVRIQDKSGRAANLVSQAAKVKDETIIDTLEDLICVPCINKRAGINPEERNKSKRAQFGLVPNIKLIPVKVVKPKTKSNNNQQPSLF